jgi:type VII secretion integral membrane protein EccD
MLRVSVHTTNEIVSGTVDLALPAALPVAELLPSIVDMIGVGDGDALSRWRLARLAGPPLDGSMTLAEIGVRDGEILVLARGEPDSPVLRPYDRTTEVAARAADGPDPSAITSAAAAWIVAAGVAVLGGLTVISGAAGFLLAAGTLALVAGAAAVLGARAGRAVLPLALQQVALVLAVAVGYRIVPGGPDPANFVLAAASGTAASVVLLRAGGRGGVWLTAVAVLGSTTTIAVGAAALWGLPVATLGALLTGLALAVLGGSARLSVVFSGLLSGAGEVADGDGPDHAVRGRRLLTGLVAGTSGTALFGVVLVAAGGFGVGAGGFGGAAPWPVDVAFCAAVGLALMLRSRSHASGWCRTALMFGAMGALTSGLAVFVGMAPAVAFWVATAAVAGGSVALSPPVRITVSPVALRAVDALEYAALVAVVPLMCWIAGVFAVVRGLSLT